jgi:REP element-mobilizing transposase RayT
MARPLRIQFPGALYHLTARGNARASIYSDDRDRRLFLDVLGEVVERYLWRCHAYCLMPNHYHLVVDTPHANLSRGMRHLNGIYTQRYNRRHGHVGHVFQGRFKGILVERESHLVELARYVVLNPVRAGIVGAPEDYVWSSLRAALGLAPAPSWLTLESLVPSFGTGARYLEFVREGIGAASPWMALRGSFLGSDAFTERIGSRLQGVADEREIPRSERFASRQSLNVLFPPEVVGDRSRRNARIRELGYSRLYTQAEIAQHLGLHYSTISKLSGSGPGDPLLGSPRTTAQVQELASGTRGSQPADAKIQDLTPSATAPPAPAS